MNATNSMMRTTLTRRRFMAVAGGALAVAGAGLGSRVTAQQGTETWRTTAAVNLRDGAGTTFSILALVPAGAVVTLTGQVANGWAPVRWNDRNGFISAQYLVRGSGDTTGTAAPAPDSGAYTGRARVLEAVNMRSGPSTAAAITVVVPAGSVVGTSEIVKDGFRAILFGGKSGWMIAGALVPETSSPSQQPNPSTPPASAGSGYINTAANFRMEPTYGNNVIRVLPVNTVVTITTEKSGEFVRVQTPGDIGWVYAAFVSAGAPPTGNPTNPPTTGSKATTTAGVNFRADAALSARVISVIPAGASILIIGSARNGFTPVYWNGTNGWVSSDYINTGSGAPVTRTYRTTAVLNLRANPNANSQLLGVVPVGATVTGTGTGSAGYLGVSWNGLQGYVLAAYLA
ncbi:MAG TPA: SH3 domain-containing protein [Thermomicrobiales bacterium]|jgi:uncharacterized protein YgiM (DUF1202 family)|nr:SH3 domain-containing protein [Thermomicrobiales bacterium]